MTTESARQEAERRGAVNIRLKEFACLKHSPPGTDPSSPWSRRRRHSHRPAPTPYSWLPSRKRKIDRVALAIPFSMSANRNQTIDDRTRRRRGCTEVRHPIVGAELFKVMVHKQGRANLIVCGAINLAHCLSTTFDAARIRLFDHTVGHQPFARTSVFVARAHRLCVDGFGTPIPAEREARSAKR